jgi:hypothetical protein
MSTTYSSVLMVGIPIEEIYYEETIKKEVKRYNPITGEPYIASALDKEFFWFSKSLGVKEFPYIFDDVESLVNRIGLNYIKTEGFYENYGFVGEIIKTIDTDSREYFFGCSIEELSKIKDKVDKIFKENGYDKGSKVYILQQIY